MKTSDIYDVTVDHLERAKNILYLIDDVRDNINTAKKATGKSNIYFGSLIRLITVLEQLSFDNQENIEQLVVKPESKNA